MQSLAKTIQSCELCPRLRKHCRKIAKEKRKAYAHETYWGKPISGFGDSDAELVVVGLAPAAHGANRTGRVFTGDRSGDWLYRALHKAGFASIPTSLSRKDGQKLKNAYITSVVKCAPPDNKPLPAELARCASHLEQELKLLTHARVYLALGQIGMNGLWPHLVRRGVQVAKPKFSHGGKTEVMPGIWLLTSYHPSQQNTFTGRLTETMFDRVFTEARTILDR